MMIAISISILPIRVRAAYKQQLFFVYIPFDVIIFACHVTHRTRDVSFRSFDVINTFQAQRVLTVKNVWICVDFGTLWTFDHLL